MDKIIKREYGEEPNKETRAEANQSVNKSLRYKQIIEILTQKEEPMTAKELAVEMYFRGWIPSSERNFTAPRLTEMQGRGVVEPVGKKPCQYTGKTVTVYAMTEDEKQLDLFWQMEEKRKEVQIVKSNILSPI